MSYNSTGFDRPKILWINELMNTFKIDCFQLQEHFKAQVELLESNTVGLVNQDLSG